MNIHRAGIPCLRDISFTDLSTDYDLSTKFKKYRYFVFYLCYNIYMSFVKPEKTLQDMNIAEGMTVADFDAGAGYYTMALAKKVGQYGKVFAIDTRADLLTRIANESKLLNLKNVEVIRGDVESLNGSGLSKESVDRVILANTLFVCDHPEKVVKEAIRILKKKGKIGVIDWIDSSNQIGPHPDCVVSKKHVTAWFAKENLILEKEFDAGDYHYGLVFKFVD
ncbi:MAG: methyltransferase domain-containing protein [bacterium]